MGKERTNGFTCTASPTTAACLNTVFFQVGEIGMAWAGEEVHCAATIVLRPLILVAHDHANRGTQSDSKFRAGLNLHFVLLVSRGREGTLTGSSARHLRLDIVFCKFHSGRAPIHDATDGPAVRFAIAVINQTSAHKKDDVNSYVVTLKYSPNVDIVHSGNHARIS